MSRTSPRFLKAIPLILILLTSLACSRPKSEIEILIERARGGDPQAQYELGIKYEKGQGVPQDFSEAAVWWRKAAERGLADAQYSIGVSYDIGQGVPQDYAEAVKWFYKAAEQGHMGGQFSLGLAYYVGRGVPKNYMNSYFWFSLATARSSRKGVMDVTVRDEAAKKLTSEQLMKAQQMTREWEAKHPRK